MPIIMTIHIVDNRMKLTNAPISGVLRRAAGIHLRHAHEPAGDAVHRLHAGGEIEEVKPGERAERDEARQDDEPVALQQRFKRALPATAPAQWMTPFGPILSVAKCAWRPVQSSFTAPVALVDAAGVFGLVIFEAVRQA